MLSQDAVPLQAGPSRPVVPGAQAIRRLTDLLLRLTAGGIVAVVLLQIAGRLLGRPFSWTEELTRACFIWMVFIGMASGMRHADAARVTIFLECLPPVLRRAALPLYLLFSLGFFSLMAWTGVRMVQQQVRMNESIATLGWPSWVIGLVVPASAVIAVICTLASLQDHRSAIALDGKGDPA